MATDPSQLMQLAQSLARSAPVQAAPPPDYTGDINGINRDYALADALAQQQYIPNSGWLGALAQAVSGGLSYYKGKKADKAASEVSSKLRAEEQAQKQAEAQRQAQERAANIERLAASYGITPEQASVVADGLGKAADFKAPSSKTKLQYENGIVFNPETGEVSKTDFYRAPGSGKAPAKPSLLSPEEQLQAERIKAGLAPRAGAEKPPASPRELPAEARNKLALYQNALREAEAYRSQVIGEGGDFNDIASRMPGASRALQSAVSAKLRAESGASIPPEEVAREAERYGPRLLSSDATNIQAVDRLVADLQNQIAQISGGRETASTSQPVAQEASVPTAVNDAGEVIEYRNGQWVKKRK